MKTLSNYVALSTLSIAVITMSLTISTVIVSAAPKESAFCTNLTTTISKVDANIANLKSKLTTSRANRDLAITNDHAKWDQQLKDSRTKWDQQRSDNFTKLEGRAKTAAQTSAVKTYETAIQNAVSTRRSANDAARATYRAGVDNALVSQRSMTNGQLATFSTSVADAEATAQAGCQATPTNGSSLRTSFQASMKSARATYTAARKADGNISSQIKQLVATRNASFQANDAAFKVATDSARVALKAAFGKNA
jgi:hypothetical protein